MKRMTFGSRLHLHPPAAVFPRQQSPRRPGSAPGPQRHWRSWWQVVGRPAATCPEATGTHRPLTTASAGSVLFKTRSCAVNQTIMFWVAFCAGYMGLNPQMNYERISAERERERDSCRPAAPASHFCILVAQVQKKCRWPTWIYMLSM